MTTIDILSPTGTKAGTRELPAEVFDVQTNVPLIHQVVVAQLAAARQGTHSTKTRADVRGGGRKPFKQKGTGRARQGSTRAPQFAGGGVVHGPQPRSYAQRTPKKMKAAALRGALSDRARHGRIHIFTSLIEGDAPSTRSVAGVLQGISERRNLLVVLARQDEVTLKSVRNIADVHVLMADQLNTYDVLCADEVIFTEAALDAFLNGNQATVPAVETSIEAGSETAAVEAPAAAASTETADFGTDSAPATEDGAAPEGFAIKGNASSKKYHVPGSRWYDGTTAEVWFRTTEAAEAAGFVPAGGAAAQKVQEDTK